MRNDWVPATMIGFCCLVLLFVLPAGYGEHVAGVKSGDWVKYRIMVGQDNPILQDYWKKITIQTVEGMVITGITEGYEADGVNPPQSFSLDMMKKGSSPSVKDFFLIPANLTTGSVIPAMDRTINGTTVWFDMEAVYLAITTSIPLTGEVFSTEYYWERITGALLEYRSYWGDNPDFGIDTDIKLIESSMFGASFNWLLWMVVTVVAVVAVTATLGLFVRRRRRLKRLAESYVHGPPPATGPKPPR